MQYIIPPTKEALLELPLFTGLSLTQIDFICDKKTLSICENILLKSNILGFDTESKPCFEKGNKNSGPHILQLSTTEQAFIFNLKNPTLLDFIKTILESNNILKVGFGLQDDARLLRNNYKISLKHFINIDKSMQKLGYKNPVGMVNTVAILLQQHIKKPKKVVLSDWSKLNLSDSQLSYAANDAYVSLLTYLKLQDYLSQHHSTCLGQPLISTVGYFKSN